MDTFPFDTPPLGDNTGPDVSITIGGYVNSRTGALRFSGYLVKRRYEMVWWYDAPVQFDGGPFDNYTDALQFILDHLAPHINDVPTRRGGWKVLTDGSTPEE